MLICFLHRSILMIMHKVSLEISNSETSHNLKGWPFYTWKDWCFSFSSQSPSLLQDRMGETDIRKFCSKASESFKVLKDLHYMKLKSESDCFSLHQSRWKSESDCLKWILHQRKFKSGSDCFGFCIKIVVGDEICSIRIIQESLKGLKGEKMQDGNSVETLHWVKLVNHICGIYMDIYGGITPVCSYFPFILLWFFWVLLTVHVDCWSHKFSEQFIPHVCE